MKKRIAAVLCLIIVSLSLFVRVYADEYAPATAEQLTDGVRLTVMSDGAEAGCTKLRDGSHTTWHTYAGATVMDIMSDTVVGGLYIIFDRVPGEYTLTNGDSTVTLGGSGFLHDFTDIAALADGVQLLTLTFERGVSVSEIYVYGTGTPPDFVQRWSEPYERADLLLFSAHSDDEHLFFAGILPHCAANGIYAQVVYMTDHSLKNYIGNDSHVRVHEQLDGLWAAGVRNYPVIAPFPDYHASSADGAANALSNYGITRDDVTAFVTEQIRRFTPLVAVGHDKNGEYGHGFHMLYSDALRESSHHAADGEMYSASAEKYGTWDTPKTYIHMWENEINLDWDTPLEYFGGQTAFQISQSAYRLHQSQMLHGGLSHWLYGKNGEITSAVQIKFASPCRFGLYRSTVGEDISKNSFFENVTLYSAADRIAAEEAAVSESLAIAESESIAIAEAESIAAAESEAAAVSASIAEAEAASESLALHEAGVRQQATVSAAVIVGIIAAAVAIASVITTRKKGKCVRADTDGDTK